MLTLPIKKKWFDMILAGEKKEEYRERTPYYHTLFINWIERNGIQALGTGADILFRNGPRKDSPCFVARCSWICN